MITGLKAYEAHLTSSMQMQKKIQDCSVRYLFNKKMGNGYTEVFKVREEFQIWITDATFHESVKLTYANGDDAYIGISYVERKDDEKHTPIENALDVTAKDSQRISYPTDEVIVGVCPANVNVKAVNVYLHTSFFENRLPKPAVVFEVLKIIQSIDPAFFLHNLNPVLSQMLYCPFQGGSQFLFLQGKVFEIAAHLVRLYQQEDVDEKIFLSGYDEEHLCEIPNILLGNIADPPSIGALARMLAINEYKLKAGFKQLYGATIYEYLRKLRIEKALSLLSGDLSIGEIAAQLGYKSQRGFTDSFAEYCGMTPSKWKRANKRV